MRPSGRSPGSTASRCWRCSVTAAATPTAPGKKDPLDCVLWRGERPGEPAWDSPFGPGRPGWHIECSAIALEYLGLAFDVQGGGSDLVFPHHEMSAGHAQVATRVRRSRRSTYTPGMVGYDGEKMSKSKGNLVFVSALRNSEVDPMAIRLALLRHHYRVRLGVDRRAALGRGRHARPVAGDARPRVPVRPRPRSSTPYSPRWPTTSTRPRQSPRSMPGSPRPTRRDGLEPTPARRAATVGASSTPPLALALLALCTPSEAGSVVGCSRRLR